MLPRYQCLEVMDEAEFIETDDSSLGGGGPQIIPCNWLQHYENVVDPFHVPVLHASFSGAQFTVAHGESSRNRVQEPRHWHGSEGFLRTYGDCELAQL